jgi:hypothetical protein
MELRSMIIAAATAASLALSAQTAAAQGGVRTGVLECRGAPTTSYVVGSTHPLRCLFRADQGGLYRYNGLLQRVGLDLGFTGNSALAWAVFAPTNRAAPGDLAGSYAGVTAGAAVGIGANANAMIGGSDNSFALQPVSFEGQTGLNVAVGVAGLELRPAGAFPNVRRAAHVRHRQHARHRHPV